MLDMRTPAKQLADLLLEEPVEGWVRQRRDRDRPLSWRRISLELRDATDGKVDVAPVTLMAWAPDAHNKAAS